MKYEENRALALYKILLNNTDERHQLSMWEILSLLEDEGYKCSKDSVGRYINQLRHELDVDIVSSKGRNAKYFIGARILEKEELKLIIDAINASNVIEEKMAKGMITKLKETMSFHDSVDLDRTTLGVNVSKTSNNKIRYNVNLLHEALKKGMKISFDYMMWNKNKQLVKKHEDRSELNPWALIWANDRYYLYGYKETSTGEFEERHYRVDKMKNITIMDVSRKGKALYEKFDSTSYVSRRIGMFGGAEKQITVKISEDLVGAFIDQFGKEIKIEDCENNVYITFTAAPTQLLYGWLIGLRDVEIIGPERVKREMIEILEKNMCFYNEKN